MAVLDGYASDQTFFDLTAQFNVDHASPRIRLALDYRAANLGDEQMQAIAGYYQNALVALTTAPQTSHTAQTLLSERLCACVNQVREVTSVYRWQGEIVTNREVVCLFKTRSDRYAELVARLTELHPYDVPEIVRLSVESVNQAYLDWVMTECDETAASSRTDGEASTHELDEV